MIQHRKMRLLVEVGDWEHECCDSPYERNSAVEISCLVIDGPDSSSTRYVETHHDLATQIEAVKLIGRVVDLAIRHPDGSIEAVQRLPSGPALRGLDVNDDGHLEDPWTGQPVTRDSSQTS